MRLFNRRKGFTLIELLIVIAIIGILAGIILVAVDPAKRLRQSRDSRRSSEVYSVLNAVLNYTVDNQGVMPVTIDATDTPQVIGFNGFGCDSGCAAAGLTTPACSNLGLDIAPTYISKLPIDPLGGAFTDAFTGYYVRIPPSGRVEIGACNPEEASSIKVKR